MPCAPDCLSSPSFVDSTLYIVLEVGGDFSSPKGASSLQMMEQLLEIITRVVTSPHRQVVIIRTERLIMQLFQRITAYTNCLDALINWAYLSASSINYRVVVADLVVEELTTIW